MLIGLAHISKQFSKISTYKSSLSTNHDLASSIAKFCENYSSRLRKIVSFVVYNDTRDRLDQIEEFLI